MIGRFVKNAEIKVVMIGRFVENRPNENLFFQTPHNGLKLWLRLLPQYSIKMADLWSVWEPNLWTLSLWDFPQTSSRELTAILTTNLKENGSFKCL